MGRYRGRWASIEQEENRRSGRIISIYSIHPCSLRNMDKRRRYAIASSTSKPF